MWITYELIKLFGRPALQSQSQRLLTETECSHRYSLHLSVSRRQGKHVFGTVMSDILIKICKFNLCCHFTIFLT
jgi:hypothetical protein